MEDFECECGSIIKNNKTNIKRHLKTKKHLSSCCRTSIEGEEQKLRKIKQEDNIDEIRFLMDEHFLKNYLMDGFDKKPLVKQIL